MRGNGSIDYSQLGLQFKLHVWMITLNKAVAFARQGMEDLGRGEIATALRLARDFADEDGVVAAKTFSLADSQAAKLPYFIPPLLVYRPPDSKINAASKDIKYLGTSRVIAVNGDGPEDFAAALKKRQISKQMNKSPTESDSPASPTTININIKSASIDPKPNTTLSNGARIKFHFLNSKEVRMLVLDEEKKNVEMGWLRSQIQSKWKSTLSPSFQLCYLDEDGDLVALQDDEDLSFAFPDGIQTGIKHELTLLQ